MLCLSSSKPSAYYKNELNAIKKSGAQLQPVYEAFSNAWKSIEERFHGELMRHGRIRMEFHYTMGLFKNDAENRTATLDKIDKKKSCKSCDLQDSVRRERDSNPRYLSVRRFSRPVHSTTLPSLHRVLWLACSRSCQNKSVLPFCFLRVQR